MKPTLSVIACVLVMWLNDSPPALGQTPLLGPNLAPNPSFESGAAGVPDGWKPNPNDTDATFYWSESLGREDSFSLQITASERSVLLANPGWETTEFISVQANKQYEASVFTYTIDGGVGHIPAVKFYTADGTFLGTIGATNKSGFSDPNGTWVKKTFHFSVSNVPGLPEVKKAKLLVVQDIETTRGALASVFFDDVYFGEILDSRGTLDQEYDAFGDPTPGSVGGVGVGFANSNELAQTFTVGKTGILDRVALELFIQPSFPGPNSIPTEDLIVEIRATTPNGWPENEEASILASAVITPSDVPRASAANTGIFTGVDFSTAHLAVESGDVLALVLRTFDTASGYFWTAKEYATYGAGGSFFRNLLYPYFLSENRTGGIPVDFGFRTFVTPSVPNISDLVLSASPNVLWPPDRKMRAVSLHVSTQDGSAVSGCFISAVDSSEGSVSPGEIDWQITSPLTVDLRAARTGHGEGRVYRVTVTCTSQSLSLVIGSVTVVVPHDQTRSK